MRFNFSSPLDMGRLTYMHMRVIYGDGEGKTCLYLIPLSCLHYASKIELDYDTIIGLYGRVNIGLYQLIEQRATTIMRMIPHLLPIF